MNWQNMNKDTSEMISKSPSPICESVNCAMYGCLETVGLWVTFINFTCQEKINNYWSTKFWSLKVCLQKILLFWFSIYRNKIEVQVVLYNSERSCAFYLIKFTRKNSLISFDSTERRRHRSSCDIQFDLHTWLYHHLSKSQAPSPQLC